MARIRKQFVMQLRDASVVPQYRKAHDEIWPEMAAMLREHGSHNYSISLLPSTLQLFGYVEVRVLP
jgi:L-rhamnose mutarotase